LSKTEITNSQDFRDNFVMVILKYILLALVWNHRNYKNVITFVYFKVCYELV